MQLSVIKENKKIKQCNDKNVAQYNKLHSPLQLEKPREPLKTPEGPQTPLRKHKYGLERKNKSYLTLTSALSDFHCFITGHNPQHLVSCLNNKLSIHCKNI